jgi:hypothetical protein
MLTCEVRALRSTFERITNKTNCEALLSHVDEIPRQRVTAADKDNGSIMTCDVRPAQLHIWKGNKQNQL